jgi:2-dehydro-3-deoxyphosphogluconate aldolase / (4S)-4-hydroxy-2-oxoglutarate aldolase
VSAITLIASHRIVPVVVIDDSMMAERLGRALIDGGIPIAEVTMRTPSALNSLERLAGLPGFVVGAGTVLTASDVERCVEAGAQFIVSPGLAHDVVIRSQELGVPVFPGVATATEIQHALALNVDIVKIFPAGQLGGAPAVSAFAAPFPNLRFMPSGGIDAANAIDYLALDYVFAVGGSWMAPRRVIAEGEFEEIVKLTRLAAEMVG